ncbi:hypothetical protein [Terriglobus roseus]|uniref:PAAR motif-containing protein n=1 Tax=Terriglobus roseus TaxID=392734 RepID=A0A1H4IXN9_9BACT|nr:hypothetical protein [Terriglobus roseus]SEB38757.1 hypothetical protein SAMN05443244_0179 [Terriglobus roseus]
MPGPLVQVGATVLCSHGGQAMPTAPNPRVMLGGAPSCLIAAPWVVAGCPLAPPPLLPCLTGQWVTGTTRVLSVGQPLVVATGQAVCVPNGTPLMPVVTQVRVMAT